MRYVIQNMLSNKFHASKHDSPLSLLANYFVPTLLQKYAPDIKTDPAKLKNIFMQSYSRIYQIFSQQPKVNPATGEKKATGGLMIVHIKQK